MYFCRDILDPKLEIRLIEHDVGFENNKFDKVDVQLSKFTEDKDVITDVVYKEADETANIVIRGAYSAFEGKPKRVVIQLL